LGAGIFTGDRWYQNVATVEILHAQVLYINYYNKNKFLLQ
jgi:hypothetical protein